jgi:hypothetical protein
MVHESDPTRDILLALRLAAIAPVESVATSVGLPIDEVRGRLDRFDADGLVRVRASRPGGWSLTAEGRKEGERLLAEEIDALGLRATVDGRYRDFRAANPGLLALCTAWQLRPVDDDGPTVPNDHADADYDRAVVERLDDLHQRSRPIWQELGRVLARFGVYDQRFDHAAVRVASGDHDWFTKPSIDSYHTVWFELHENLLATLGIDRSSEQSEE